MTRAAPEPLTDFAAAVLEAEGVPAGDARLVARCLVEAQLWGHSGSAGTWPGSAQGWSTRRPSPRPWPI